MHSPPGSRNRYKKNTGNDRPHPSCNNSLQKRTLFPVRLPARIGRFLSKCYNVLLRFLKFHQDGLTTRILPGNQAPLNRSGAFGRNETLQNPNPRDTGQIPNRPHLKSFREYKGTLEQELLTVYRPLDRGNGNHLKLKKMQRSKFMKKQMYSQKLVLKKETISNLAISEMNVVNGGNDSRAACLPTGRPAICETIVTCGKTCADTEVCP